MPKGFDVINFVFEVLSALKFSTDEGEWPSSIVFWISGPDIPLEGGVFGHSALVQNDKLMIFGGYGIRGEIKQYDILE